MILRLKTQRVHCSYRKKKFSFVTFIDIFFVCIYLASLSFHVIIIITGEPILFDSDKNDIVVRFSVLLGRCSFDSRDTSLKKKVTLNKFAIKSFFGGFDRITLDQVG